MKTVAILTFCCGFFGSLLGSPSHIAFGSVEVAQKKISLEATISSQLTTELESFLPKNSYVVLTSVDLQVDRVREIKEGERTISTPNETQAAPVLPGFEDDEDDVSAGGGAPAEAIGRHERTTYHMVDRERLKKVAVSVLFDHALANDVVEVAKKLVTERMRASYGAISKTSFSRIRVAKDTPMSQASPSGSGSDPLSWIKKEWLTLAAIFVAALLILAFLAMLIRKIINRPSASADAAVIDADYMDTNTDPATRYPSLPQGAMPPAFALPPHAQTHLGPLAALPESAAAASANDSFQSCIENLFKEIADDPLSSFHFLAHLDDSRKVILRDSFADSPLREGIVQMIGEADAGGKVGAVGSSAKQDEMTGEEKSAALASILQELQQYKRLLKIQLEQKMGFLHILSPKHIVRVLEGKDLSYVRAVVKFLPHAKLPEVVGMLPMEVRRQLLRKDLPPLLEAELEVIETQLRLEAQKVSTELLRPERSTDQLAETIIEQSADQPDFLREVLAADGSYTTKFGHLLATFDDLIAAPPEMIAAAVDDLSNESIALTARDLPEDQRGKFLASLPKARQDVVAALAVSLNGRREVRARESAKAEILASYRQLLQAHNLSAGGMSP